MTVLTPLLHLGRLAASAMLAVVLVLSAGLPSHWSTKAIAPTTAGTEAKSGPASTNDESTAECLFCGSTICSGLDALLETTAGDVAVIPPGVHPALRDRATRLPQPRAPPAHAGRHLTAFDPRGPPSAG